MATFTGILLLTATTLALAGCAQPTAQPSQTPEATCDPESIAWETGVDVGRVPVGVQLVTYTDGGATRSVEVTTLDPGVTITPEALTVLGDGWERLLLDDLDRTRQIDENFGATPRISDEPAGESTPPVDGQFVIAVDAPVTSVPFTVACGGTTIGGAVSAVNGGLGFTLLSCAEPAAADATPAELTAREYCAG